MSRVHWHSWAARHQRQRSHSCSWRPLSSQTQRHLSRHSLCLIRRTLPPSRSWSQILWTLLQTDIQTNHRRCFLPPRATPDLPPRSQNGESSRGQIWGCQNCGFRMGRQTRKYRRDEQPGAAVQIEWGSLNFQRIPSPVSNRHLRVREA